MSSNDKTVSFKKQTGVPIGPVGTKYLPQLNLRYTAKTPKPDPFITCWAPVNGSNRKFIDKTTEKVILYHSQKRQDSTGKKHKRMLDCYGERAAVQLQDDPYYNSPIVEQQRRWLSF